MKYIDKLNNAEWNKILETAGYTIDVSNKVDSILCYIDKCVDKNGNEGKYYVIHAIDTIDRKYVADNKILINCEKILVNDFEIICENKSFFSSRRNITLKNNFIKFLKQKFPTYDKDIKKYLFLKEEDYESGMSN